METSLETSEPDQVNHLDPRQAKLRIKSPPNTPEPESEGNKEKTLESPLANGKEDGEVKDDEADGGGDADQSKELPRSTRSTSKEPVKFATSSTDATCQTELSWLSEGDCKCPKVPAQPAEPVNKRSSWVSNNGNNSSDDNKENSGGGGGGKRWLSTSGGGGGGNDDNENKKPSWGSSYNNDGNNSFGDGGGRGKGGRGGGRGGFSGETFT